MTDKFKKFKASILGETLDEVEGKRFRGNYGRMDGSQKGLKSGGQGRNRTLDCRHPEIKNRRIL